MEKVDKKSNIGVQTFFLIFMSLLMVWIIVFGFQKIFIVDKQLSEQDRLDLENKLKEIFKKCEDPLNKGNIEKIKLVNRYYNSLCLLSGHIYEQSDPRFDYEDLKEIYDAGDNVVLLKTTIYKNSLNDPIVKDYQVVSSINVDINLFDSEPTLCFFDNENTGVLQIEITC